MAKILLGATLGDIRGSQGGTVYSRNRYANYTRQKTSPVNPNTAKQQAARNLFGSTASAWRSLTGTARLAWGELATALAPTNVFGNTFSYTAQNVYMASNQTLQANGLTGLTVPDTTPPTFLSLSVATTADISSTTLEPVAMFDGDVQAPATIALQMQGTGPVSVNLSQSSVVKQYRNIFTVPAGFDFSTPTTYFAEYIAIFGLPLTGGHFWLRFRQIDTATGVAGPWIGGQVEWVA